MPLNPFSPTVNVCAYAAPVLKKLSEYGEMTIALFGVAVGIGVAVGTGDALAVGIGVGVGVGATVGDGVGVGIGVAVGTGVAVAVATGVGDGDGPPVIPNAIVTGKTLGAVAVIVMPVDAWPV